MLKWIKKYLKRKKKCKDGEESMTKTYEPFSVKIGLNAFAKSIDPRQPARTAKLFAIFNFSACQKAILHHGTVGQNFQLYSLLIH